MAERFAARVAAIALRLERWLATSPDLGAALGAHDERTLAFCRARLPELVRSLSAKVASELGDRTHRPLGRVLVVIAEHDVLGTVMALVGAHVTGNRVRIKARATRSLLEGLVRALAITDCEVLDWSSHTQDDAVVLAGIDAVLLAGGDELIAHYRRVTPPGVRLIELGSKVSCAAVGPGLGAAALAAVADALVDDVTLFAQGVCSSPQWILADDPALAPLLRARLAACPPLSADVRLAQYACAETLRLRARLGTRIEVELDSRTGWGVTVAASLEDRLPRGFAIVPGVASQLAALAHRYPRALQVLGTAGEVPAASAFTHRCPIGRMHLRSPLAPHDGVFELASLVAFTSSEPGS